MSSNVAAGSARQRGGAARAPAADYEAILRNPKYQELVRSRNSLGWTLSILTFIVYLGFILLVAFDKTLLGTRIGGGTTTLGILLGLIVIVLAFLFTAIYVARANGRFDELTREITREAGR